LDQSKADVASAGGRLTVCTAACQTTSL